MRTLNEQEIQAVSGSAIYDPSYKDIVSIGGKLIGDKSPTFLKVVVGAIATPFLLLAYAVTIGQIG